MILRSKQWAPTLRVTSQTCSGASRSSLLIDLSTAKIGRKADVASPRGVAQLALELDLRTRRSLVIPIVFFFQAEDGIRDGRHRGDERRVAAAREPRPGEEQ